MSKPLRRHHLDLHHELHARPAVPVHSPGRVSSWIQHGMPSERAHAALAVLARACGQPVPVESAGHAIVETKAFILKFERHGEFVSWQVSIPASPQVASPASVGSPRTSPTAIETLPSEFLATLESIPCLSATHIEILEGDPESLWRSIKARQGVTEGKGSPLLAAHIADRGAMVATTLHLGTDGFTEYFLIDAGLSPDRRARTVQRLCELEAYRMLAMLGFPVARDEGRALQALESQLQTIVEDMAHARAMDDSTAFDALLRLSADIEHAAARTRYRLSASRAYHRIVQQRLQDLREERIEGHQKLSSFFNRRFAPAMALCESTDHRITDIAERINRAVDLARVRVEARREANNQELLRSLAHRQQLQLRLQQTVEGLSVVAISYYAVSLVAYLAKAAKGWELPGGWVLQPDVMTAVAVVPVVAGVAWLVSRIHHRLGH